MPSHGVLFETFVPLVAASILDADNSREGMCFCSLALQAAQVHVYRTSNISLSHHPMNLADYFATLSRFLTQTSVDVFAAACERHEELYGPGSADTHVRQRTIAEHVSDLFEQFARDGTTITRKDGRSAERPKVRQSTAEPKHRRWKRLKSLFQKVGEKLHIKSHRPRYDSVITPAKQQKEQGRSVP